MDEIKMSIYTSRVLNAIGRQAEENAVGTTLFREVQRAVGLSDAETWEVLRELEGRGFIETGRAINDTYIRIKK